MSTSSLQQLLKAYTAKTGSAVASYDEFCEFAKTYAEHHAEGDDELNRYLVGAESTVREGLFSLEEQHLVCISETAGKKSIIFVPFITEKARAQYEKLLKKPSLPFPSMQYIPKQFPREAIVRRAAPELFSALLVKQNISSGALFCVAFPGDVPPILLPESVSISTVAAIALSKIGLRLIEEDTHDYFYKKLMVANSDREASIKLFFSMMVSKPQQMLESEEIMGERFYYWNQLCFFIKKDHEKIKEFSPEDAALLQAVNIAEQYILVLKDKTKDESSKTESFLALEDALAKPPYFYALPAIGKFTDSVGKPLLGRYSEEELKAHIKALATSNEEGAMPRLLCFTSSGTRYYVYKEKVFPLIARLTGEAHDTIEKRLASRWYSALRSFERLDEMHDKLKFEKCLQKEIDSTSPILSAILAIDYLPLLEIDVQKAGGGTSHLFRAGQLLPPSQLLCLSAQGILSKVKRRLPFWYSIPILNRIIALFVPARRPVKTPQSDASYTKTSGEAKSDAQKRRLSNRASLAEGAKALANDMIPQGSTIDRELDSYCKGWNKLITESAHNQLTEDVNALIYSYSKNAIKTVTPAMLDDDTITAMAEAILRVPNMKKITNQEALLMYVKLYILRLITNG